jgi:hypothetical protein
MQYTFLKEGRVKIESSNGLVKTDKESMSHSLILDRLSEYAMRLDFKDSVRLEYLFFVASIAKDVDLNQDRDFFFDVTLSLLNHHKEFLTYNKQQLTR